MEIATQKVWSCSCSQICTIFLKLHSSWKVTVLGSWKKSTSLKKQVFKSSGPALLDVNLSARHSLHLDGEATRLIKKTCTQCLGIAITMMKCVTQNHYFSSCSHQAASFTNALSWHRAPLSCSQLKDFCAFFNHFQTLTRSKLQVSYFLPYVFAMCGESVSIFHSFITLLCPQDTVHSVYICGGHFLHLSCRALSQVLTLCFTLRVCSRTGQSGAQ